MNRLQTARERRIRRLVRLLRAAQRDDHLTMTDMAARLGVSTSTLSMVYSGRRNPGRKLLRGILRAYPQLQNEVYVFLTHETSEGEQHAAPR